MIVTGQLLCGFLNELLRDELLVITGKRSKSERKAFSMFVNGPFDALLVTFVAGALLALLWNLAVNSGKVNIKNWTWKQPN